MTQKYLCCWQGKYLVHKKVHASKMQVNCRKNTLQSNSLSYFFLRALKEFPNANIYLN